MKRDRGVGSARRAGTGGRRSQHQQEQRRRRRWTVTLLSTAIVPVVGTAIPSLVHGVTKTFSTTETEWTVPGNWSPAGVPTASDDALINGGTSNISLSAASASVLSLSYDGQGSRTLGNATSGGGNSVLTLVGTGTSPAIDVASGAFTIAGPNIDPSGTGTGRLGLTISNSQTWSSSAGASLTVSADVGDGGGSSTLTFTGLGTITLSGNNSYTGGSVVDGATVSNLGTIKGNITIQNGGTFVVDPSNGASLPGGQLDDNATIELDGGTFSFQGTAGPTGGVEVVGLMKAKEKANRTKCSSNLRIVSSGLQRDPGATLNVTLDSNAGLTFTSPPQMTNGIIGGWATGDFAIFSGTTWEKVDNSGSVQPLTTFQTSSDPSTWSASDNVRLTIPPNTLTPGSSYAVNSLKFDGTAGKPVTMNVGGDLTVSSGGILATGISDSLTNVPNSGTATPARLLSGGSELFVHVTDAKGTFTIGVPIADGGGSGTPVVPVNLVKAGDGTLLLNADNTLTGDVDINTGRVRLAQFGTLIDSTVNIQDDRALLGLRKYNKTIGGLSGSGGTVDLDGANLAIGNNGRSTSFGGQLIAAGGSITKVGSGSLTLTAISLYTGDTTVAEGSLTMDGVGALADTRAVRIRGGSVRGASARSRGGSTISLMPNRIPDGAVMEMGGGTYELDPGAFSYTENIGLLKLTTGNNAIKVDTATAGNNGTIRYTGSDFQGRSTGATLDFQFDGTGSIYFTSPPTLTNGIIGSFATVNGADWASVDAAGRIYPLPGYWRNNDATTWDDTKNVQPDASVTVSASTDTNTLKLTNNVLITLTGNNFFSTSGIIALGNTSITGSGSMVIKSRSGHRIIFDDKDSADRLGVSVPIADNPGDGPGSLVKSGPGTLVLAGATTYTGDTYVNQGTLQIGAAADLISSYVHQSDDGVTRITGAADKHLAGLDGGGSVQFGTGALSIGGSDRSGYFSGTITSLGGSLEKLGAGTLDLSDASGDLAGGDLRVTNGRVRINDLETRLQNIGLLRLGGATTSGTLELTGVDPPGGAPTTIAAPTLLGNGSGRINKVRFVFFAAPISGSGGFTDSGGTSNYLVSNSMSGALTIDGAQATLSGAGAFPSVSSIAIDQGGSLALDFSSGGAAVNRINDAAPIELSGGTLALVGSNGGNGVEVLALMKAKEKANRTKCASNLRIISSGLEHTAGATLDVQLESGARLTFTTPPPLNNGILGEWATVNSADWATIDAATGDVQAYAAYTSGPSLIWSPRSNVRIDGSQSIASNVDISTLRLAPGGGVAGAAAIAAAVLFRTNGILDTGTSDSITGGAGSALSAPAGGSKNIGLYVSNVSGSLTIAVPIVDNNDGSVGLTKSGDGTLVLSAPNTYTGVTDVQRGTLKEHFQNGDIPTQNDFEISTGATLDLDGNTLTVNRLAGGGTVVLGSAGGGGGGGSGGALGTLTVDQASNSILHVMTGDGNVIKRGAGSLTLDGPSPFTGTLDVAGGSLVIDDGGSTSSTSGVTVRATANLTIKEAQTSKDQLEKNPRNRLAPINPVAPITMDGGTFAVSFAAGLGRMDAQGPQDFGPLTIGDGGNTVSVAADLDTTASIQFASVARDGRNNINWVFQGGGALSLRNPPSLTSGIMGPWATVNSSDWATVTSDGEIVPYAAYRVNADPQTWNAVDNVLVNLPATLSTSCTANTVKIDHVPLTLTGGTFCSTNGILATGSGGSISGPGSLSAIKSLSGDTSLIVCVAQDLSIASPITDNAGVSVGLIKSGDGTLSLTGASTYTGDTTINEGTLELLSPQPLGGNILIHGDCTLRLGGGVKIPVGSTLTLADGSPTIDVQSGLVAHIQGGAGDRGIDDVGFTKTGGGTLSLDGDNSYGGPTTIAGGTLQVASGHSLGDGGSNNNIVLQQGGTLKLIGVWGSTHQGSRVIAAGGTFDTNGFNADIGDINGDGDFTKQGGGSLGITTCACNHLRVAGGTLVTKGQIGLGNVPNVSRVTSLTVDAGAQLDLTIGKLITKDPVGAITIVGGSYTGISGMIQSGRNGGTFPLWDGSGIVTSQSEATARNYTSIGVAAASDIRPATATATALWAGQVITGTDTLVMYTYGGDATLDGKINVDDYIRIDSGIAAGLSGWSNGDFNYDGKVNIDDYTSFIDANIGTQGSPFSSGSGIGSGVTVVAVPEPSVLGVGSTAAMLVLSRRRRRR